MTPSTQRIEQGPALPDEQAVSVEAFREVARYLRADPAPGSRLVLCAGGSEADETRISIPSTLLPLIAQILERMSVGQAFGLVPRSAEFTTQEAADFLNVSRPYFVRLVDMGALAHRKVGTHRRVKFEDLLRYKQDEEARQREALAELMADSQKQGYEY